jgi:hypothetical protein
VPRRSDKAARLRRLSRPHEILLEEERSREGEFLDLFEEQLLQVAKDADHPTAVEVVTARRIAAQVWGFDRLTSDGRAMSRIFRNPIQRAALADHFAEADIRGRLSRLCQDQVSEARRWLDECRRGVAPVPELKVLSGGRER